MEQTGNYGFSQWDEQDRILREDFNADNLKTEQALAGLAEQVAPMAAQVGKLGNCQVYYKTYTGNGDATLTHTHTFPSKPLLVLIYEEGSGHVHRMIYGCTSTSCSEENDYAPKLTWSGNSVTFKSGRASEAMNSGDTIYHMIAFIDMSDQ